MTASPHHLCLVSNQPVPSLTPLLDPRLAVKRATLVATPERTLHARWLKDALKRHGIGADIAALRDGYDLPALREDLAGLAALYPQGATVNVTGGTKLMTLAAWEVFSRPGDRLYYVDIRHDRVDWLRPPGLAPLQVADCIRLETYFTALGQHLRNGTRPGRQALPADRHARFRARARSLAAQPGPSSTGAKGGYWLEELVFEELRRLAAQDAKIHDVGRQFVLTDGASPERRLENEIDVAVLRDNTLHLVECKTGAAGLGSAAIQALFKLAQLRESLGGLRGRGIFVSTEQVSPVVRERGRQLNIGVIDRSQLGALDTHLRELLHT